MAILLCICIYIYICTYTCIYICIYICIGICIRIKICEKYLWKRFHCTKYIVYSILYASELKMQ